MDGSAKTGELAIADLRGSPISRLISGRAMSAAREATGSDLRDGSYRASEESSPDLSARSIVTSG